MNYIKNRNTSTRKPRVSVLEEKMDSSNDTRIIEKMILRKMSIELPPKTREKYEKLLSTVNNESEVEIPENMDYLKSEIIRLHRENKSIREKSASINSIGLVAGNLFWDISFGLSNLFY